MFTGIVLKEEIKIKKKTDRNLSFKKQQINTLNNEIHEHVIETVTDCIIKLSLSAQAHEALEKNHQNNDCDIYELLHR